MCARACVCVHVSGCVCVCVCVCETQNQPCQCIMLYLCISFTSTAKNYVKHAENYREFSKAHRMTLSAIEQNILMTSNRYNLPLIL